jgi:hypothetical protein
MNKQWLAIFAGVALVVSAAAQTSTSPGTQTKNNTPSVNTQSRSTVGSSVTLPAGTAIGVTVNETLSSAEAQQGDRFTGVVQSDVTLPNGSVVISRGAEVQGRVLSAKPSGRLSDAGELQLSINTIRSSGTVVNVSSEPFIVKGESHTKSNTTKIGGGAALGAIIGAVAGGGKGAAIGAGVGGAAGTGAAAATGKREAVVEREAVLTFVTAADTRVTTASSARPDAVTQSPGQDGEPVLRRRDGSTADPTPANAPGASTSNVGGNNNTESSASSASKSGALPAAALSLRDKRVLSNCLHENAASFPAGILTKSAASPALTKGTLLPANMSRQARSLPLACDRELPALPNDMERVVYGGQVLLLDANSRILDVFDLP